MLKFPEKFDEIVIPGESLRLTIGNVEVRATAEVDAWGEYMVNLSVRAGGHVVDDNHEAIGGIDPDSDGDYLTETANELLTQLDLTAVALRLEECARTVRSARDLLLANA